MDTTRDYRPVYLTEAGDDPLETASKPAQEHRLAEVYEYDLF